MSQDQTERMAAALHRIGGWADAYPVEAFTPLDETQLTGLCLQIGPNVFARLHAQWARHILDGVRRLVAEGLGE